MKLQNLQSSVLIVVNFNALESDCKLMSCAGVVFIARLGPTYRPYVGEYLSARFYRLAVALRAFDIKTLHYAYYAFVCACKNMRPFQVAPVNFCAVLLRQRIARI